MSKMSSLNRRQFLYYSSLAASSAALTGCVTSKPRLKSLNEKLNIGVIGVDGKGAVDAAGVSSENIIALCDVDEAKLNKAGQKYPGAKLYRDYRKMLDAQKGLDGIVISTPDHHHAPAAMRAITLGYHIYLQKPLTHTIYEARRLTEAARKYGVMTQMGNQGRSGHGVREVCELIWSGAIGDVREVHCWTDRPIWPQGLDRPAGEDAIPAGLDWDLWLGPAPKRSFKSDWTEAEAGTWKRGNTRPVYHPFSWRGWWDFGCGALGDMGCHIMDPANWALKLGAPTSVEMISSSGVNSQMAPKSAVIRYEFPARGVMGPVTLTWHDGGNKPARPAEMEAEKLPDNGTIFIGTKGKIICGAYGGDPTLLPESKMKDFIRPVPTLERIPNQDHYQDWIRACKTGKPACSNFDVAGPFTETVLLGNLALRLGKKIEWDSKNMRATNAPEADIFIRKKYRHGWAI